MVGQKSLLENRRCLGGDAGAFQLGTIGAVENFGSCSDLTVLVLLEWLIRV